MQPLRFLKTAILLLFVLVFVVWTLFPIAWMVLSSFKPNNALFAFPPKFIFTPTGDHYAGLFTGSSNFAGYIQNSVIAAVSSTVISIILGTAAGYGLARSHFRGKADLSFWIISTRMAPIAAVILPLYLFYSKLHLLNTLLGLVIAYLTFSLPFAIWLMNAFFVDLPIALEEAAKVDGASKWQSFVHIVLPLSAPGVVTTAILCFIFAWNDYAFATTFGGPGSQTIPIAAAQLMTQSGIDWGKLMAIGTVTVLPMIFFGMAVRRWLVRGLTLGAVK
ncbi:MAG TPA: carbohydrate ABC transporter permease [Chthoniobacterales bacterium]